MKLSKYSRFSLGLLLSAFASTASVFGHPSFVSEWATEIRSIASSKNLKIESSQQLEDLLISEVSLDSFDASCSALLQKIVKETSGFETLALNLESALDICSLINPWNSMECSGVTGVTASYARSIQEFVRLKDNKKGDLRAACIIASAIAPGRPFVPLVKGSIKSKCEETCSGAISKTISSIDAAFCSLTIDLCSSVDFTLYNAFTSLNEKELGIAVAVSVLLSEGSLGVRTSFREGCRFVLSLKKKGIFPSSSSDVSELDVSSNISEFYASKLADSGLLAVSSAESGSSETVFFKVLVSQITKAMKSIINTQTQKKQTTIKKKPVVASTHVTSSEVSPLSESSDESLSSEVKATSRSATSEKFTSPSPVLESWFNTIKQSIKKGSKDIDTDFDEALNQVVAAIDSSSVYFSCVSELKKHGLSSHRRITEACRKIDPFSHIKCQKLNHFELRSLIKLREELEKFGGDLVVDLRDLCAISPKISMETFLRNKDEELSSMCIKALKKRGFKSKYPLSDRAIKKACIKSDYFRSSSCGNLVASQFSERLNLVLSLANNMFDKKGDKERLQIVRESEFNTPSFVDICGSVERLPAETVEDCIYELRDSFSKFKSVVSLMNIESACISSIEEAAFGIPRHGFGVYDQYYQPSIYPGAHPAHQGTVKRFYKDIEHSPPVDSYHWFRKSLPESLKTGHIEQEFSESRKGFYKDSSGKSVFHDGFRYRLGDGWYVKIGNDWYLDGSTSLDFVKILPTDPRYNPYPLSLYEKSPSDPKGLIRRKSFATYLSPTVPQYQPVHYLQHLYGKPGTLPYYPSMGPQHFYDRCTKCNNWIPYGHEHDHSKADAEMSGQVKFTEKNPSLFDKKSRSYITETNDYDSDGKIVRKKVDRTYRPEPYPLPGHREVGVQVKTSDQ